jgi:hypothetical protein
LLFSGHDVWCRVGGAGPLVTRQGGPIMARYLSAVLAAASLLALTAATQAQSERTQKLLGSWSRHADGCKVQLEVKPDSLRCTVTTEDGFAISVNADYVVSKDGILLGILHARPAKKKDKDKDDDGLSKRLFYLQVTADEKALVISDLNYGDGDDDKMKEVLEGKYHKTEGKRAARAAASPTPTLPSARYLQHPPQYSPPATDASPMKAGQKPTSASNPRVSELLNQSEDQVQILHDWERVWLPDEPSHLTPERVHGGIK